MRGPIILCLTCFRLSGILTQERANMAYYSVKPKEVKPVEPLTSEQESRISELRDWSIFWHLDKFHAAEKLELASLEKQESKADDYRVYVKRLADWQKYGTWRG